MKCPEYKTIANRINAAVAKNKSRHGVYAVSLEGKLLFGFSAEKSEACKKAEDDLRKQGYQGRFIYYPLFNPKKNYVF